jgi:MFS transporter, FHS family, glucose/mannose:H+ symporter
MTSETSAASNPSLRVRIPLYPTQFLVAMALASIGPLLHPIMRDLGIPLSRGGLLSAGLYVGNVSAVVILNTALARFPARRLLASGTLLQGAALVAAGAATRNLWSLIVAYMFMGFGGALMNTTCWIWLSAHMVHNRAASALRMILFFALAMMLVPVILGLALDAGASWRWILVAEGCLALTLGLAAIFLPLLDVCGRQNVRLEQFREVIRFNPKLLLGMVIAGFTYVGAEMILNIWLPKFQIDVFGSSDALASLAMTLFWVGLVTGRLVVMTLTRRFSPARLLLVLSGSLAVFAVALAFAPSQGVSLVLSVGTGLAASASYGLIGSYAGRFPGWQAAVATSLFILSGSIGSIAFPYLVGPLASAAGFRIAIAVVAAPALVYGGASLLIHAHSRSA